MVESFSLISYSTTLPHGPKSYDWRVTKKARLVCGRFEYTLANHKHISQCGLIQLIYLSIWNYVQTLWGRWFRSRSVTNNLFLWMNLVWVTIVCSDIWTFVPEAATCCYSAEDCSVRWHHQTSSAKKELFVLSTLVRHWKKRVNASLRAVQFQWERRRWGSCNEWGWQLRSCIPKFFATWYYMLPFLVLEWTSWLEWLCFNILKLLCVVVSYLDTDFQHVSSVCVCVGRLKRRKIKLLLAGGHGWQSGTMFNEATWL